MEKKLLSEIGCIRPLFATLALTILFAVTGCQTSQPHLQTPSGMTNHTEAIILREGDVVKVTFPGNSNLDTTQPIRRDGRIVLSLVGELTAVGLTPAELEKEILKKYEGQLLASQEVTVTVQSSSFPVFITGAVIHPGKVESDHPISALEAIMEAGGFDYSKANLKAVVVIRQEGNHVKNYTLNLKKVLDGKDNLPFYLKPSDIVFVREKFTWF